MTRLLFVALIALPACAQSQGSWPSLAPRAIETTTAEVAGRTETPTPQVLTDVATRLNTASRDFDMLTTRWKTQADTTRIAVTAATGQPVSGDAWSNAQLELSRMEQLGNQIADLRDHLDHIAGDLAAAMPSNGAALLARTGSAIAKVEALRDEHKAAFDAANAALPPR